MEFLIPAAGLLGGLGAYVGTAAALARSRTLGGETKVHMVETDDGWRLPLYEYPGPAKGPVIFLQHGLSATHRSFDLYPHGPSAARDLAAQGYHVFAGNLRGRPLSSHPKQPKAWGFSHYLLHDLPPMVRAMRALSQGQINWVGHSMGGILGLAYAGHFGGVDLASVTTVGSALNYNVGPSVFAALNKLRPALQRLSTIPWRRIQHLSAPLAALGWVSPSLANRRNLTRQSMAAWLAHGFVDMTRDELLELGTTFEGSEGILCQELNLRLVNLAAKLPVPWFAVYGDGDMQCSPACGRWTLERVDAPRKESFFAGRAAGLKHDYGHYDLIAGRYSADEVWPRITRFIEASHSAARLT